MQEVVLSLLVLLAGEYLAPKLPFLRASQRADSLSLPAFSLHPLGKCHLIISDNKQKAQSSTVVLCVTPSLHCHPTSNQEASSDGAGNLSTLCLSFSICENTEKNVT
jgi:hypothetical protein